MLLHSTDNASGQFHSPEGFLFPPFLVMHQCTILADWLLSNPSALEIVSMSIAVFEKLAALHGAGFVHRDLRPEHVAVDVNTNQWCLLGAACISGAGASPPSADSLPVDCCLPTLL